MPKIVDHDKRKELIADATMTVMKQVGFEKTTVRKIASEVGFSMGTVQYYFPAQYDLYIYAMKLILQRMKERITQIFHEGIPVIEGVVTILKQLIPHKDEDQIIESEAWLAFSIMALRDPALKNLSQEIYSSARELMVLMLNILHKNDYLEDNFDLETGAMSLHAYIDGLTIQAILYPNLFDESKIELLINDYLQNICKKKTL